MKEKQGDIKQAYEMRYEDSESVVAHYADWASKYDADTASYGYIGPRSAALVLARFCDPAKTRVLDVGCGTGLTGVVLREAGFQQIDGSDISPEMIDQADLKGVYESTSIDDLFAGLAFETGAYDAVVSVGTFGPIGPEAIPECLRVVRQGGLLCISVNELFYDEKHFDAAYDDLVRQGSVELVDLDKHPHLLEGPHDAWIGVFRKR